MPKAIVPVPALAAPSPPPRTPGHGSIYELHVRGFTRLHPGIPEAHRAAPSPASATPRAIAHLQALGVTHVELMPVAAWIDERHLPPLGLDNDWGYNPVGFLAPDPRLAPGGMEEVRAAVAALQAAGIGVILDVVYNHTGEGDELGPTLSLRGLDNAAYYRLGPRSAATSTMPAAATRWRSTGRRSLRLAMDALRHWVVGGGRRRLPLRPRHRRSGARATAASTRTRRCFAAIAAGPAAARADHHRRALGHRPGRLPARRTSRRAGAEWNDRFRDTVRRFWRGDARHARRTWRRGSPARPTSSGQRAATVRQPQLRHRA